MNHGKRKCLITASSSLGMVRSRMKQSKEFIKVRKATTIFPKVNLLLLFLYISVCLQRKEAHFGSLRLQGQKLSQEDPLRLGCQAQSVVGNKQEMILVPEAENMED